MRYAWKAFASVAVFVIGMARPVPVSAQPGFGDAEADAVSGCVVAAAKQYAATSLTVERASAMIATKCLAGTPFDPSLSSTQSGATTDASKIFTMVESEAELFIKKERGQLPASAYSAPETAAPNSVDMPTIVNGSCIPTSHTAAGLESEDLSTKQSRFFCNKEAIFVVDHDPNHILIEYADNSSPHSQTLGFGGLLVEPHVMKVTSFYIGDQKIIADDGWCKFFDGASKGSSCGAVATEDGKKTVSVVGFEQASSMAGTRSKPEKKH